MPQNDTPQSWLSASLFEKGPALDEGEDRLLFSEGFLDKLNEQSENIPLRYEDRIIGVDKIIGKVVRFEIIDNKIVATFEVYNEIPLLDRIESCSISYKKEDE